ncbi:MAG: hypothetical protein QOD29_4203, partial [Alphaproteobacteria bacterium]|nr:hypothetical protein [Alphaproteobacteria bacterium]
RWQVGKTDLPAPRNDAEGQLMTEYNLPWTTRAVRAFPTSHMTPAAGTRLQMTGATT